MNKLTHNTIIKRQTKRYKHTNNPPINQAHHKQQANSKEPNQKHTNLLQNPPQRIPRNKHKYKTSSKQKHLYNKQTTQPSHQAKTPT